MSRKTIAIIPARGGSKRCPQKNVALFKGRPLVAHSIDQALRSRIFDQILVSADDPEIMSIAADYDVLLDRREEALASDNAPLIDLIRHLIHKYAWPDETVLALLLVTGPLRTIQDIINSYHLFLQSDQTRSVVSVTPNEYPVEMNWQLNNGLLEPYLPQWDFKSTKKQDFPQSYRYNDAAILDLAGNFSDPERNLFGKQPLPYIMPLERSLNIDYQFQLKLVQLLGMYDKQTIENA